MELGTRLAIGMAAGFAAMKFEYEVFNASTQSVVTEGHTWHVVMSPETRKAMSIPGFMKQLIARDPHSFERLDQ